MAWLFSRGLWQITSPSFVFAGFLDIGKLVSTFSFLLIRGFFVYGHGSPRIQLPSLGLRFTTCSWFCFAGSSIRSVLAGSLGLVSVKLCFISSLKKSVVRFTLS